MPMARCWITGYACISANRTATVVRIASRSRLTAGLSFSICFCSDFANSALVTLPLILIAYSQSTGVLFGAGGSTIYIGVFAWALAVLLLRANMRAVTRARLLGVADEQ